MQAERSPTQKILSKAPALASGAAANAYALLAATLAWLLTPSTMGRAATWATLGAAAAAGKVGGSRLRDSRAGVVPAEVAAIISESGLRKIDKRAVAALAARYGSSEEEFDAQLAAVYGRYLEALVDEFDEAASSEISSLGALRRGLGLGWNATKNAHLAEAAKRLGDSPPSAASDEIKKLVWLSKGLFASSKGRSDELLAPLLEALAIDGATAADIASDISAPIYQSAVTQAVVKYNRTEAPEVLGKVRAALCLGEVAASRVHNTVYEAQLDLLLPAGSRDAKLDVETMALLGELEGMLQIRAAGSRIEERTVPLFRLAVNDALAGTSSSANAIGTWAGLALRQQQLSMTTERARAGLVEEARRIASERVNEAARLESTGESAAASEALADATSFCGFIGSLIEVAGFHEDEDEAPSSSDLAQRYLGALSTEPSLEEAAQKLAQRALDTDADGKELASAMLALVEPKLKSAKEQYSARLDGMLGAGAIADSGDLDAFGVSLGLPSAVRRKLALNAYYGWLLDLSEGQLELENVDRAEAMRGELSLDSSTVGELYANTEIDSLVLTKCLELAASSPSERLARVQRVERALAARVGVAAQIMRSSGL